MRKIVLIPPQDNLLSKNFVNTESLQEQLINKPQSFVSDSLLATVILESANDDQYNNQNRMQTMKTVIFHLTTQYVNNGIIVFPAGMFYREDNLPSSIYSQVAAPKFK